MAQEAEKNAVQRRPTNCVQYLPMTTTCSREAVVENLRVLVVSHNVLSESSGMGKTLANMLSCVPEENLAQLYFHSEVPTLDMCTNYYRVTDGDVLRSLITRRAKGTAFAKGDIQKGLCSARTDSGAASKAYQFGRRRTPLVYSVRNALWKMGVWDGSRLRAWVRNFAPDVIFFASGDYSFAYKVAYRISCECEAPIVMWCCDDYYLGDRMASSFFGRLCRKSLMKKVRCVTGRMASLVVISDEMKRDYARFFECPIQVLRIAAEENPFTLAAQKRSGVVYAGSLGVGRAKVLAQMGAELAEARIDGFEHIDVYTGDRSEQARTLLENTRGVLVHAALSKDALQKKLGSAKYILHVESSEERFKARTKYSISTKIGESLQSGACIVACGPSDLASMAYLKRANAALMVEAPGDFPEAILWLEQHPAQYEAVVENARNLAYRCHNKVLNDGVMTDVLYRAKSMKRNFRKAVLSDEYANARKLAKCGGRS